MSTRSSEREALAPTEGSSSQRERARLTRPSMSHALIRKSSSESRSPNLVSLPAASRATNTMQNMCTYPPQPRNTARSNAKSCLRAPVRSSTTFRQPFSSHNRSNTSAGPMRRAALAVARPRRRRRRQSPWRRSAPPNAAGAPIARSPANPRRGRAWRSPAGAPRRLRDGFRRSGDRRGRRRSSCGNTWRGTVGATETWSPHNEKKHHASQTKSTTAWHYIFA